MNTNENTAGGFMAKLRKLFGGTEMTWKLLLIYSVVTGVTVGLLNCVPALENTSFTMPAVNFEYWFVAAIFVIVNCQSTKEAALKTFIFFLISQPLIYLVEVPFKELGWGLFGYYKYWAILTVLTIPGAAIAYQIKRDNVLSAAILSVATGFLLATGFGFVCKLQPGSLRYVVSVIFCAAFGIGLIFIILRSKKAVITGLVFSVIFACAIILVTHPIGSSMSTGVVLDPDHSWEIVETDATVELSGNYLNVTGSKNSSYRVTVRNENGETESYDISFEDGMAIVSEAR